MLFVDPLFQQSLVRVVRRYNFSTASEVAQRPQADEFEWTGLPVMFDEVFTGLYRLGRFSSASFLGVHPDISVHAKLLTGGLLPLSITAASESIFAAFLGDAKSDALLHGHSYTAHPIGCHVANVSLQAMDNLNAKDKAWRGYKADWRPPQPEKQPLKWTTGVSSDARSEFHFPDHVWSMWSQNFVLRLSTHKRVAHVNALGSVLAISLVDKSGSGEFHSSY
jgi:dethiobiotin synthetase/adenosylmethionine--8-amino-7-oxononanoate aminotransferase